MHGKHISWRLFGGLIYSQIHLSLVQHKEFGGCLDMNFRVERRSSNTSFDSFISTPIYLSSTPICAQQYDFCRASGVLGENSIVDGIDFLDIPKGTGLWSCTVLTRLEHRIYAPFGHDLSSSNISSKYHRVPLALLSE